MSREGGHTEDSQDTGNHSGLDWYDDFLDRAIEAHTHDDRRQKLVKGGNGGKYDQCDREDEKYHFKGLFLPVCHFGHSIEEDSELNQVAVNNLPSFFFDLSAWSGALP